MRDQSVVRLFQEACTLLDEFEMNMLLEMLGAVVKAQQQANLDETPDEEAAAATQLPSGEWLN